MEGIRTALFEDPLYAYISLVVAELVLAAVWYEKRTRRRLALLLVPPVLAGGAFLLERFVVTDRERIVSAAEEIARDVERGSVAAARTYLHDDVFGHWATKAAALEAGQAAIRRFQMRRVALTKMRVEVRGDKADMHAVTVLTLGAGDFAGQRTSLVWDLVWVRTPEGWRIRQIKRSQPGVEF